MKSAHWKLAAIAVVAVSLLLPGSHRIQAADTDEALIVECTRPCAAVTATVAAAGIAPADDVAAAVDILLERLPEFPVGEPADALQPAYGGRTVLIVAPDVESAAIGVFGPLPSTEKLGGILNVLALEALDRRLARALHREFGDAYDISARPANYARDVRLLAIGGEVAAADLQAVLEVTRRSYEWFRARGPTPREAAKGARHAARISSGISNGPCVQPSASRVAATSSLPSGAPCEDSLPALFGEPKPMVVRQQTRVGLPWVRMASSIAALMLSGSCPSTSRITVQP